MGASDQERRHTLREHECRGRESTSHVACATRDVKAERTSCHSSSNQFWTIWRESAVRSTVSRVSTPVRDQTPGLTHVTVGDGLLVRTRQVLTQRIYGSSEAR